MANEQLFGDEKSSLRENPVFRKYMEEYNFFQKAIDTLEESRGYLSYTQVVELKKLKKLKLAAKDGMLKCHRQ